MENKYYTPKLEEFYPGFEYEYQDEVDAEFEKKKYTQFTAIEYMSWVSKCKDIPDCLAPIFYRVKYIDKEDIESLGWLEDKNYYILINPMDKYKLYWKFNNILIWDSKGNNLAKVPILNKSELKKLMKQLGIEYEGNSK